ncbi:hypothetical protein B296_00028434 [Ensete ventricosum]|uniref:Uncharacterized protein n=1 Tax=Ensete ventricosum TaxID=4639 RepID=A0A427AMV0_ENSVE|nr:hypothetical protein B296_00028434 [Ensete ventricosum]
MGHGWVAKSNDDGYGGCKKMKKMREVVAMGSVATRKGSRSKEKEEGSDSASSIDHYSRLARDVLADEVRLMITAAKMMRNYNKVAEMTTEEGGTVGDCDMRLEDNSDDNTR